MIRYAVVIALLACDADAPRQTTTVRRDYPTLYDDAQRPDDTDEIDASEVTTPPETIAEIDGSAETSIEEIDIPETTPETTPETIAETVADPTPETIAETTPETTAETTTEVDSGPTEGEPCQVGSLVGACLDIADCGADMIAAEGFCDGGPRTRCCLDDGAAIERCSAARAPGVCMASASCPGPDWKLTSGLCPGAADIRCCTATTAPPLCDPGPRPTPNDGLIEEPGEAGCPAGMVFVPAANAFCMDRFEASLVLAATPGTSWSPYHNPASTQVRAVSVRYGVPQGYIDEVRAKAACNNAGKRLCTTDEWLYACQGDAGWTYPYGPTREAGRCNDDRRQHVAVEYFGTSESWIFSEIDNACLTQLPASLDLAGENEGCQTPLGIYDLMGNLHEWVDDAAGTFRGGFFDDTTVNGNGCLYRTTAHDVSHWDYSTGFRCCADAP